MSFDRNCRVQSSQFNIREIDNCLFTLITKIHSVSGFGKPNTINCYLKHLLISKFYSVLGFGKSNTVNLEHFMSEGREQPLMEGNFSYPVLKFLLPCTVFSTKS